VAAKSPHPACALGIPAHHIKARRRRTVPHAATVAVHLKRFPGGLPAFDPNDFYPNTYALSKFTSDHVPIGLQLYTSDIGAHTRQDSAPWIWAWSSPFHSI
jgi:hypothetical protein